MRKNLLAFAAAASLLSGQAWSLDLSQAYGEALEHDATIRSVQAATDARRERLPQARAQLLPDVSASVSRYRNWLGRTSPHASGQLVTSNLRYTRSSEALTLRQPLFRMYQMADYRQAQAQADDAEATLERELQNVGARVSGAYFEALLAEEHLALVLAQRRSAAQRDPAQARFVYLMSRIRLQALSGGAKAEVIDEINGWLVR